MFFCATRSPERYCSGWTGFRMNYAKIVSATPSSVRTLSNQHTFETPMWDTAHVYQVECVGSVDSGLADMSWSPDQEIVVLATGLPNFFFFSVIFIRHLMCHICEQCLQGLKSLWFAQGRNWWLRYFWRARNTDSHDKRIRPTDGVPHASRCFWRRWESSLDEICSWQTPHDSGVKGWYFFFCTGNCSSANSSRLGQERNSVSWFGRKASRSQEARGLLLCFGQSVFKENFSFSNHKEETTRDIFLWTKDWSFSSVHTRNRERKRRLTGTISSLGSAGEETGSTLSSRRYIPCLVSYRADRQLETTAGKTRQFVSCGT